MPTSNSISFVKFTHSLSVSMSDTQNKQLEAEVADKEKLPNLPDNGQSVAAGTYKILETKEDAIDSQDAETHTHLWFKSPVSKEVC